MLIFNTELAYTLLRTLRASTIAGVVDRLAPILHMDPMLKLPPEITAEIFSYLDPSSLLTASMTSREWRARILDSRLWKHLYIREGWAVDTDKVRIFEEQQLSLQNRKARTRQSDADMGQPKLKKRVPPGWIDSRSDSQLDSSIFAEKSSTWNEQHSAIEADNPNVLPQENSLSADTEGDHEMQDANYGDGSSVQNNQSLTSPSEPANLSLAGGDKVDLKTAELTSPVTNTNVTKNSSLFTRQYDGSVKLNWTQLYKQRRRLEDNWRNGRFTNFQLPHPSFPHEAHRECVYVIQFCGRWLVSGSRDRTVRVWDLVTRRLRGTPLVGHSQSVLCLQFDPSDEEDIIASGSSDNSVIIWQFSTGKKIHVINNAHGDSVLNLRFDSRFLVTCSKDRLIKVWNRRELCPTDENYPSISKNTAARYPSYIVDTSVIPPSVLEAQLANDQIKSLSPYSLLMTIDGHGAAVNAIQIDENEIVSASGDRLIKVWNIHTGACLKSLIGHQKGIACVQFDSRRIVSGSNDDTVRIYDHASGAEVACLHGHSDLVRTVQAGFGDPPGAEEALRLEAMAVDKNYLEALRRGEVPREFLRSRVPRSGGSRDPKDIMALGAKIPPGGGGSHWGRIVSGSYDETIIIWKKDESGRWVVGQRLRQEEASRAALEAALQENASAHISEAQTYTLAAGANHQSYTPQLFNQRPFASLYQQPPQSFQNDFLLPPGIRFPIPQPRLMEPTLMRNPTEFYLPVENPQPQPPIPPISASYQIMNAQNIGNATPLHTQNTIGVTPTVPAAHHPNNPPNQRQPGPHPTSRVFKLQFDARKLICASQDFRIVGWDFACGDADLEEACKFFIGL